jgi:uncharacterized protein YyaL (SSP411 family)
MYVFVVAAVRLMGKRQIGELQLSELVVAILISELAAIPMQATSIPLLAGKPAVDGRATAYICENFTCRRPINSLDEFRRVLAEKAPTQPQFALW